MLPSHYSKKETSYFCRFTFGQFFTILVLEIFTLFFVFYLGARYGDELLGGGPSAQAPRAPVDPAIPQISITTERGVSMTQDPEIKAMAREILSAAPTPDLKRRVAEMLEESAANKASQGSPLPKPTTPAAPKEPATLRAAPRPEEALEKETPPPGTVESVSYGKETTPEPAAVIQTAPKGRYTIQVGSYPSVDEAHAMADRWRGKGYPAYMVSADIPNKGRWYRIRVGGFDSKEAAEQFTAQLVDREQIEAFVVTNE